MKKFIYSGLLGLSFLAVNAQTVQQDNKATSGGLGAGTTAPITMGENTFYGYQAGHANTNSGTNTFIGHYSGANNSSGSGNTFTGSSAGRSNTLGTENTYIGVGAGKALAMGSGNTAVGSYSGVDMTYGHSNTFLGYYSGCYQGISNTHIGIVAGYASVGNNNVYLGGGTGTQTTGSGNVFIGYNAGAGITTDNTFLVESFTDVQPAPLIKGDFVSGKVGISVTDFPTYAGSVDVSNYKFFVKGGILAEEIRVATTWADYVFAKDYKLPTLTEVEQHIASKGHLINVPSAKEVEENGISLGEIAKIQQEKIEELTLYIIEQNKMNEKQTEEIKELKELVMSVITKK